jgi:branched-chain amino acid transport system permease protein
VQAFFNFTIIGIITGAIYAVAASGLVVTYTTSGIFNFAHGAIGMVMAFVYWELRVNHHWPAPIALFVVIFVLAPLVGAVIERTLMRNLRGGDTGTSLVVTIGLLLVLIGVVRVVWPPDTVRVLPLFYQGRSVKIGSLNITYHQWAMLFTAIGVALLLRFILFSTRYGIAMRAVVDDRDLAALNGAQPHRISQLSWALGSMLAAVAGILLAPQLNMEVFILTFLVVKGYAAAVVGKLTSLPRTFMGAVGLGLLESYARWKLPARLQSGAWGHLFANLPTLFLLVGLLALPAVRLRVGRVATLVAPRVPSLREAATGGFVIVVSAGIAANVMHGGALRSVGVGMAIAIILLSLVLLTGYGGQISLAHFTLAGVGAFTFGKVAAAGNPLALLIVAGVSALVGALMALPALRLQGLYLALLTLALAKLADDVFFLDSHVLARNALKVHRVAVPGFSLHSAKANLVLLAIVFALMGNLVLAIRRGPFGRLLGAMRDSPAACAHLGLDLTRTKLGVFALSAAMAGVGGALYGGTRGIVTANDFVYILSLVFLLMLTIGGVNTMTGALLGGMFFASIDIITPHIPERLHQLPFILSGVGAMTVGRNPNGIAGQIAAFVDRFRARSRAGATPAMPEQPEVRVVAPVG